MGSFDGLGGDGLRRRSCRSAVCSHEPTSLHHYITRPVKGSATKEEQKARPPRYSGRHCEGASALHLHSVKTLFLFQDAAELFFLW